MDLVSHQMSLHHPVTSTPQNVNDTNSCAQAYTFGGRHETNIVMANTGGETQMSRMNVNGHTISQNELPQSYDTSQDRRKRRKTSHEPESETSHSPVAAGEDGTEAVTEHDAGCPDEPSNSGPMQLTPGIREDNKVGDDLLHPVSPASAPKKRGRPPKSAQKNTPPKASFVADVENARHKNDGPRLQKAIGIPEKATMKISANGKLFGSLQSSQSQAPSTSSDVKTPGKATRGGKSLALKNGKLARNLIVVLKYDVSTEGGNLTGAKIEQITSGQIHLQLRHKHKSETVNTPTKPTLKSTHPFFLAKAAQQQTVVTDIETADANESKQETKKPVAWKDLAFKSNKPTGSRAMTAEKPVWPPLAYQHIGVPQRFSLPLHRERPVAGKHKSKIRTEHIADNESILSSHFPNKIDGERVIRDLLVPEKLRGTSAQVLNQHLHRNELQNNIRVVSSTRNRMLQSTSAFDRAEPSGPYPWTQQYSPKMWEEVLQSTSHVLFEWLSALVVHNVKQGLDSKQVKQPAKRRKRPKKRNDEFADFIDFEDESEESTKVKNAILIVGPNGCGKTASVFAVAKQLGFEVFEIHPGMRRSQKDIFEKVGDMTQNHMVQRGQNISRDSSVLHDVDLSSSQEDVAQPSLTSFLAPAHKKAKLNNSRAATPQPAKQTQKQSLILIEEVDQVFEDDRGFWSGVQALIQNSKRPVVLTCNETSSVPLSELELFNTLIYTAPPSNIVAEYLCYIAAAEGHIIQQDVIRSLYASKGQDLRATITELQFWCQMAVGSTQGGLDWFPSHKTRAASDTESVVRTFSKDTFRAGLDLLPLNSLALEENLRFANESLDIPYDNLFKLNIRESSESDSEAAIFHQMLDFLEARSDTDCVDAEFQPLLYSVIGMATPLVVNCIDRRKMLEAKIESIADPMDRPAVDFDCLSALSVENSIHSLGHTRLAASLDSPRSVLACEVAPYIRSIVSYDLELERQRDGTFSSQGKKSRTTRAARAAAEGGDKASTRRERWFTASLDVPAVLRTGNSWPQWSDGQQSVSEKDETEASSPA